MKKSIKVITAVMAAVMSASVLSAAASATDYYYQPGEITMGGVSYDNGVIYDQGNVYYENPQEQNVEIVYVIPTTSNTVTYYDGDGYYVNNSNRKVKVVTTTSDKTYPQITVDTNQTSVSYTFLSDAEYATGIPFDNAPTDVIYNLNLVKYSVIDGSVLQIKYYDKDGNAVAVRKGFGKAEVSGDRTRYDISKTAKINKTNVTCYGYSYEFGRQTIHSYYLATFYKDGYSYSIKSNLPMTLSEMQGIAKDMMS